MDWSNFQEDLKNRYIKIHSGIDCAPDEDIFKALTLNCVLNSDTKDEFEKSWSKDLQSRFPNGGWRTINGARVFINNGKVVAGLGGFNKEIDKFFEEKKNKEGNKKENDNTFKIGDIYEHSGGKAKVLDVYEENGEKLVEYKHIPGWNTEIQTLDGFKRSIGKKLGDNGSEYEFQNKKQQNKVEDNIKSFTSVEESLIENARNRMGIKESDRELLEDAEKVAKYSKRERETQDIAVVLNFRTQRFKDFLKNGLNESVEENGIISDLFNKKEGGRPDLDFYIESGLDKTGEGKKINDEIKNIKKEINNLSSTSSILLKTATQKLDLNLLKISDVLKDIKIILNRDKVKEVEPIHVAEAVQNYFK